MLELALLEHHCCSSLLHLAASFHTLVHVCWFTVSEKCICEDRLVHVVRCFCGFTDFIEHDLRACKYSLLMLYCHVLFILLHQHACFVTKATPCANTHNKANCSCTHFPATTLSAFERHHGPCESAQRQVIHSPMRRGGVENPTPNDKKWCFIHSKTSRLRALF